MEQIRKGLENSHSVEVILTHFSVEEAVRLVLELKDHDYYVHQYGGRLVVSAPSKKSSAAERPKWNPGKCVRCQKEGHWNEDCPYR